VELGPPMSIQLNVRGKKRLGPSGHGKTQKVVRVKGTVTIPYRKRKPIGYWEEVGRGRRQVQEQRKDDKNAGNEENVAN